MLIKSQSVKDAVQIAQNVSELFILNSRQCGDLDKSIDDFRAFMATYGQVNVLNHQMHFDGEPIRGATIVYDDHYDVVLLSGQDAYWKRFVEFKEHFHVILDVHDKEKVFRNSDFVSQVEKTFAAFPDMENTSEPHVAVEKLAEIAAMEFLMPYATRSQINENIQSGVITLEKYTEMYKLPAEIIDLYLSNPYIKNLADCS